MRPRIGVLAVVAATVVALSGVSTASAAQSIPLNVSFTTTTVLSSQPCSGLAFVGDATFTGPRLLDTSTFHVEACNTLTIGPGVGLLLTGTFTITPHNGATIVGTGSGETDGPHFTHWTYAISGGSKQFSHASGSLDLS